MPWSRFVAVDVALNQQRQINVEALPTPTLAARLPQTHHESWDRDSKRFMLNLKRRELSYDDVASFCEKQGWGRPSEWSPEDRNRFLDDLDGRAFTELYDPELLASKNGPARLDEVA